MDLKFKLEDIWNIIFCLIISFIMSVIPKVFNTSSIMGSLIYLIFVFILKREISKENRKLYKIFYMILQIYCFYCSFSLLIVRGKDEIQYIHNSFEIKKEIFKPKKIYYNGKEISSELREEIQKKLSFKEVFLGDIEYGSRYSDEKYIIILDKDFKIRIIKDSLNGNIYLEITDRYYKKLDVELDF